MFFAKSLLYNFSWTDPESSYHFLDRYIALEILYQRISGWDEFGYRPFRESPQKSKSGHDKGRGCEPRGWDGANPICILRCVSNSKLFQTTTCSELAFVSRRFPIARCC